MYLPVVVEQIKVLLGVCKWWRSSVILLDTEVRPYLHRRLQESFEMISRRAHPPFYLFAVAYEQFRLVVFESQCGGI